MAKFNYIAKTSSGENKKGIINAVSEDLALTSLQSHGLIVISLQSLGKKSLFSGDLEIFNRVKSRDMVIFSRVLATLLEVQLPLVEGINILKEQQKKNKYFATVLDQVVADIQDGNLLSEAMSKHPKVFSALYVAMVQSGEVSGGLQQSLLFMADYMEDQYDLNNKVRGALMYPGFVLGVFFIIGLGVAYFVLPQLVGVLEGLGSDVELPWTTQIIIVLSEIIQRFILLILLAIAGAIGGFIYFLRTPAGKQFGDKWQLKLPIFGQLFTKIYVARFAQNMQTLLQGGIPILSALKISASVVGNTVFTNIIKEAMTEIKNGSNMSKAFFHHPEFPFIAAQIIAVGEKTGKISSVLETIARFYKKEVDVVVDSLTVLIEPVMIVGLGIGVAIFVVSILMPIYNVTGAL
jgi:type IV pilus assembly protein PilC